MTATPDVPPSKGMTMIAAYRAARLRQRSVLQTSLHDSHVALKAVRCQGQAAAEPAGATTGETPAPAAVAAASPGVTEPASISFGPTGLAVPGKRVETTQTPADAAALVAQGLPPDGAAVAPSNDAASDDAAPAPAEPVEATPHDRPLAEIGFGPAMLIRLSQLGFRTTGDLAHADANELRAALGDISRLVDVEGWIASARSTASTAPADVAIALELPA